MPELKRWALGSSGQSVREGDFCRVSPGPSRGGLRIRGAGAVTCRLMDARDETVLQTALFPRLWTSEGKICARVYALTMPHIQEEPRKPQKEQAGTRK